MCFLFLRRAPALSSTIRIRTVDGRVMPVSCRCDHLRFLVEKHFVCSFALAPYTASLSLASFTRRLHIIISLNFGPQRKQQCPFHQAARVCLCASSLLFPHTLFVTF
jgi:hypothetical protein